MWIRIEGASAPEVLKRHSGKKTYSSTPEKGAVNQNRKG
jgi:hypothetical protein